MVRRPTGSPAGTVSGPLWDGHITVKVVVTLTVPRPTDHWAAEIGVPAVRCRPALPVWYLVVREL